jgi:imidazoleglycerol phosphate dehydratase HisB
MIFDRMQIEDVVLPVDEAVIRLAILDAEGRPLTKFQQSTSKNHLVGLSSNACPQPPFAWLLDLVHSIL